MSGQQRDLKESDYWFWQRYDALMFNEHERGHPQSDPQNCQFCD